MREMTGRKKGPLEEEQRDPEKKHKTEKAMLTSFAEWFYKSDFDYIFFYKV